MYYVIYHAYDKIHAHVYIDIYARTLFYTCISLDLMILAIVLAPNAEAAAASMTECDVHFFAGVGGSPKKRRFLRLWDWERCITFR